MEAMGKPRVVREMDILQMLKFLSSLATEEPHVRPYEVVQGLKKIPAGSDCSQLGTLLLDGWPLRGCWVLLCRTACRGETERVAVFSQWEK